MTETAPVYDPAREQDEAAQAHARLAADIADAVDEGEGERVRALFDGLHPADAADIIEHLEPERQEGLAKIAPDVLTGEVLTELQWDTRSDMVDVLEPGYLAEVIQELDSDDMTVVVEELDDDKREAVLASVPAEDRARLESSLAFDEDTAGRLMQREFVAAPLFWTVGHAIDHMRTKGEELPDLFFEVFIVDEGFRPVGAVPVSRIMRSPRGAKLQDIMDALQTVVRPETDQEDVAHQFAKYHLISAPVVDDAGRLAGMLTVDDIVDVIQEENKEDILALAGVNEAGSADTVWSAVKSRAPWLLVNLGTAALASVVISMFDAAIAQLVALAVLMPIVAALGGNAGNQTLAVAVRAIATRELRTANARRTIQREALTGLINGVIFAVVLGLLTGAIFSNPMLGGIIAVAMVVNLFTAGLAGILIPLGLKKAGADPAVASAVFVTTVTDIVGFFVFLGLGALILL